MLIEVLGLAGVGGGQQFTRVNTLPDSVGISPSAARQAALSEGV